MKLAYLPNLISCVRLLLIIPLWFAIIHHEYAAAFFLFVIAGVSDGLDGFLARRYGWTSYFGGIVDPIADKLLMMVTYILMVLQNYIPIWLVLAVISRDVIIMAGVVACYYWFTNFQFKASLISKVNTVLQIVLIIMVLINLGLFNLPAELLEKMMYLVLATTVISFLDYFWIWSRRALALWRRPA
ncbi:CDP-alcohol phosphatidyltransferase family protein [soil metagenome]